MKKNKFLEKFQNKTKSELQEILENKKKYTIEAVEAAKNILTHRINNPIEIEHKKETDIIKQKEVKFIPKNTEYQFKHSFFYKITVVFGITFFSYLGYIGWKNGNENFVMLILIACVIAILNFNLIKNKPVIIIINNQGIWTNRLGHKNWTQIENIVVENKGFIKYLSKYINDNLFIYLSGDSITNPSDSIDLRGISNKELLHILTEYYLENKPTQSFEKNTLVHGSTIYDTKEQLKNLSKSLPKLVLVVLIFSLAFPIVDIFRK